MVGMSSIPMMPQKTQGNNQIHVNTMGPKPENVNVNANPDVRTTTAPNDVFKPNEIKNPPIGSKEINEKLEDTRNKDEIINSMLVRNSSMSNENAQDVRKNLSVVNTDALRFAANNDMKIQVLKKGDSLLETGAVKPRSMENFQNQAPQFARQGSEVLSSVNSQYKDKLAAAGEADQKRMEEAKKNPQTGMGMMGGGFGQPIGGQDSGDGKAKEPGGIQALVAKIPKYASETDRVNTERRNAIDEELKKKTDGQVMLYNPHIDEAGGNTPTGIGPFGGIHAMRMKSKMPASTDQMARTHGARTPEEMKQFNQTLETLNGDRLNEARADGLKTYEGMKDSPYMNKDQYEKQLADYQKHPEHIPIDHNKHDILVPNLMHYRANDNPMSDGKDLSKPTTVNVHDNATLKTWQGSDGKVFSRDDAVKKGIPQITDGQYMRESNLLLLRGEDHVMKNPDTMVHEFGHGMDNLLEQKKPDFYSNWKSGISDAFKAGEMKPDTWISDYSRTNEGEYIAEGFTAFHNRSKVLKTMDPKLHGLIDQMNQAAQAEGRMAN